MTATSLSRRLKARRKKFQTEVFTLDDGIELRLRAPSINELVAFSTGDLAVKARTLAGLVVLDDGTPYCSTEARTNDFLEGVTAGELTRLDKFLAEKFAPKSS